MEKTVYIRTSDPALLQAAELLLSTLPGVQVLSGEGLPPAWVSLTVADEALGTGGLPQPVLLTGRGCGTLPFPFPREAFLSACRELLFPAPGEKLTYLPDRRCRLPGGTVAALSEQEWRLLTLLREAGGAPVSRAELCRAMWGTEDAENLLAVTLHHLRKKLEPDGVRRFVSMRGVGLAYREE